METIQSTAVLKSDRILRRVLETWRKLHSLKHQWKTMCSFWCEKLSRINNNNNNNNNNKHMILSQNVQNIRWNHKLYRENHENPESGIDRRREKFSWNKDPKRYIPRRCTITISIYNCDVPLNHILRKAVVSILLYGCTTWTLTKRPEKKLDGNYTRMLRAILNKSWWQHPTKHQLYGYLPPITKTIQVIRTRHAGHCRRSKDELISDVLLWTPTYGRAKAGRPARTYIQQLYEDTGCSPEDMPEAMNDWEKGREWVRDIRATSTTWWWWWWHGRHQLPKIKKNSKH